MAPLSILLWIKIIGTFFPVAAPLLVLPKAKIDALSGFSPSDVTLYRLYGMAVLALLVGYAGGYFQVEAGLFPIGVLAMGFVSNAGAFAVMVITGRAAKTPFTAAFFGLIAVGLAIAFLFQDIAMTPLW
ncbi:MAG: hypothetical protein AAF767_08710 [Pseudomonadota bacterium]